VNPLLNVQFHTSIVGYRRRRNRLKDLGFFAVRRKNSLECQRVRYVYIHKISVRGGFSIMAAKGWIKTDEQVRRFAYANDDILNKGVYINLMQQLNRLARHTKGGASIKTQRQYYSHEDQFTRFLADDFGTQSLSNISGQHVAAYVEERQAEGKSASTIDSDLSAIRYFHDQFGPKTTRHSIPDNTKLGEKYGITLDPRVYGGVNRRWTWPEVGRVIDVAS
jgi:integrase/recombinase XerD